VVKAAKRGPYLAAATGSGVLCQAFLDWFRGGMNGEPPPMKKEDQEASGHIFAPDGLHLEWFCTGWHRERGQTYTAGSGGQFAKGAMSMGATAEEAIRVAMQHDTSTGGEITVLTH
jgi:hypothetical protein